MAELIIEGMEELLNKLSQISNNVDGVIDKALKEAGNNVKDEMQKLVRVSDINHTHIKDDIQISEIKGEGKGKYIEIGPGKETSWRSHFLEFGTVKMSANPFVEPAYLNTKRKNMELIKKRIMEAL